MQPRQAPSPVVTRPTQSDPRSRPAQPSSSTRPPPPQSERRPEPRPTLAQSAPAGGSAERPIEFKLKMPQAKSALIAGSFNNWDPKRTPMRKDSNGGWKATIALRPGRYEYRFVADGQWITDPNAKEGVQNPFGSTNSVIVVTG